MDNQFARRDLLAATAAILAVGPAWAQDAKKPGATPIKTVASLPTLIAAVPFLMRERGYDKEFGLATEIQEVGGSSTLQVDAVLSGNALFGHPGTLTALQAIREGADIRILGGISANQFAAVISKATLAKVGVSPSAPIADRIKALKGLTVATNPLGSTTYQFLEYMLRQSGLNPERDVRLVGIQDSNALISGIDQGRFDVIVSATGLVEQAISLNAGELWFNGARGDFPDMSGAIIAVVIASGDTVDKKPELVKQYMAGVQKALDELNKDHVGSGAFMREKFFKQMDQKVWDTVWANASRAYPPDLKFGKKAFEFWLALDPKGPSSFSSVDYKKIVYQPVQAD